MGAKRPNFLIFMTDMQSGSLFGNDSQLKLPHAGRLMTEGIAFSRAYTPTPHCCPSRATFCTGLYPSRHGVFNNVLTCQAYSKGLRPGVATIGEQLRDSGYKMVYTGKWHVSGVEGPSDRGWEALQLACKPGGHDVYSWRYWQRIAEQPDEAPRNRGEVLCPGWERDKFYGVLPNCESYQDDPWYSYISPGIKAIPQLAAQDAPWCLFMAVPERKYIVPEKYAHMYDPADVKLPANYYDKMEDKPNIYKRLRRQIFDQLSEEEAKETIAHGWGYWTMIDEMLGEALQALEDSGAADNTVVIYCADHGTYAGAHGLFWIGLPAFNEQYNIPLIIRWPRGIAQPGRTVDEFVTLADIAPTLLELAGCAVPEGLTGRSIMPFLQNKPPADWTDCFCSQYNGTEIYYIQRFVMTKEYKYVYNTFDFDELYDLTNDPHEMVNIADRAESREIIRDMTRRMWQFACREQDIFFNGWSNMTLAPFGPADGLRVIK